MNAERAKRVAEQYASSASSGDAARIEFMSGLWALQAAVTPEKTEFSAPTSEQARESLAAGRPVFSAFTPALDRAEFAEAVTRVVAYVAESSGIPAEQAAALRQADFGGALGDARTIAIVNSPEVWVSEVAEPLVAASDGVLSAAIVAFVLHSALVPFLVAPASRVLEALGDQGGSAWSAGSCPVCGSSAAMGRVGESTSIQGAARVLWCASCHAEWTYDRIRCVRCGCRAADKLRYTHDEGDPAHRLHLCDECHGYVRFVFENDLRSAVEMVVEDVVTAPLNALAIEMGYSPMGDGGSGAC